MVDKLLIVIGVTYMIIALMIKLQEISILNNIRSQLDILIKQGLRVDVIKGEDAKNYMNATDYINLILN